MFNPAFDSQFQFYFLSEEAITVQFGASISTATFEEIKAFNALLEKYPFQGLICTVPAYTTLTVYYDPLIVQQQLPGSNGFEKVSAYLKQLRLRVVQMDEVKPRRIEIPVCYAGSYAPDLEEIARHNKLSTMEVIALHTAGLYRVYMMGFVPGFAYMGGMDARLNTPRKATPRSAVPAGAVGIAGNQTGIYPLTSPGGWQIMGQTPLQLFSIQRTQPALLQAGDMVVFNSIDEAEFEQLKHNNAD